MVDLIFAVLLGGTTWLLLHLYHVLVLKPWKQRSKLENQGIRGPPPSFFLGNIPEMKRIKTQAVLTPQVNKNNHSDISHDWFPTLFPHLEKWRNEYGSIFLYSTGNLSKYMGPLLGKGIISSNGSMWAHQRKIIAPEFFPQEQDLLQQLANGAKSCGAFNRGSSDFSEDRFIIDNCKNLYFAGHESTANASAWSLMLLAAYPDWQDRVRAEVLETCKGNLPNADELRKMKTLTMVIQEVLRLYSPAFWYGASDLCRTALCYYRTEGDPVTYLIKVQLLSVPRIPSFPCG